MNYFDKFKDVKSVIRYGGSQTHHVLSVVIPTYKKPVSLKRAIESVLQQKNKSLDFNIVVVENYEGNVSDVISMLTQIENPNCTEIVYYQNEKNIGMHPNWNRAFELANADYALMVHTDDFLLPQCFYGVEQAIKGDLPAVILNRMSLRTHNDLSYKNVAKEQEKKKKKEIQKVSFYKENCKDVIIGAVPVAPTGFLIKKSVFISSGGYNTKSHTWPADLEYAFNLIDKDILYYCSQPLVVKTEGDGNDGSNLKSTVPLVINDNDVFYDVAKKNNILFANQIIGMRMAAISKVFGIDYDTYLSGVFPKCYLNKVWLIMYKIIRKIYIKKLENR